MPRAQICSSSTAESRNKICDLLFGSAKGTSSLRPSHIRSKSSRWNWALRDTCRIPARRSARSVSFLSDSFNLQNPRDCHTQRANGYLEVFLDLPYLHTAGHSRCTVCVGKDAMTASSGMECKKSNTTVFTARNKTILACASKRALFKKNWIAGMLGGSPCFYDTKAKKHVPETAGPLGIEPKDISHC